MCAQANINNIILKDTLWPNACSKLTIKILKDAHNIFAILTSLLLTFEQGKVFQFIISQAHIKNFQNTESEKKKKAKHTFCLLLLGQPQEQKDYFYIHISSYHSFFLLSKLSFIIIPIINIINIIIINYFAFASTTKMLSLSFNTFHATGLFLYPLKTGILWFSSAFRVYRKKPVA